MKRDQKDIERILSSISDADRAQPNPFLFGKIMNRINQPESAPAPVRWVLQGSIAAALLVGLNIFGLVKYSELEEAAANTETVAEQQQDEVFLEDFQDTESNIYFTYSEE